MNDSNLHPDAPVPDPVLDRAERRLARLEELAELAMELARVTQRRAVEAQLTAQAAEPEAVRPPARDHIDAFDRAARAVRLTTALQLRLEEELKARRQDAEARTEARARDRRRTADAAAEAARSPLDFRKDELRTYVGEAIDAETTGREARLLYTEFEARLEREHDGSDLPDRPLGAVIAQICAELGVDPDWSLWEEEGWTIDETLSDAKGSPYAAGSYRRIPPEEREQAARDARARFEVMAGLSP